MKTFLDRNNHNGEFITADVSSVLDRIFKINGIKMREKTGISLKKIYTIIHRAQKALHLRAYKITCRLKDDMPYEDYSEIETNLSKQEAVIYLNRKRLRCNLQDTIIHELLHLFFSEHLGVAENVFERQKKLKSLKKYLHGEEKAIQILSTLLKKWIFSYPSGQT